MMETKTVDKLGNSIC